MTESFAIRFVRKSGIRLRQIDDAGFLADSETQGIFHLNNTGVAIWHLLEEPVSPPEIVEILCQAFPDIDRTRVTADVTDLIGRLERKDLIHRVA